jgi:hypothetical protein
MNENRHRFDGEILLEEDIIFEPMLLSESDDNPIVEDEKVDGRLLEQRDREIHRLKLELAQVKEELREAKLQLRLATIQPIPHLHDEDVAMESQSMSTMSLGFSTFTPSTGSSGFSAAMNLLWKATPIVEVDDADALQPGQPTSTSSAQDTLDMVFQQPVLDPYGDKGVYTGQISKQSGWPHGHGRLEYENQGTHQRIYDGEWCHGRWNGVGKANFANGDSYEGDYKLDQVRLLQVQRIESIC